MTIGTTGCGTLLYQERIHEPHSRDIDWKIAALNGLGLAFFFVPGVVAFAVDFWTGAIYLPPDCGQACHTALSAQDTATEEALPQTRPTAGNHGTDVIPVSTQEPVAPIEVGTTTSTADTDDTVSLQRISVPAESLRPAKIELVVGQWIGRPITLSDRATRVSELDSLQSFARQERRHRRDRQFGATVRNFFGRVLTG